AEPPPKRSSYDSSRSFAAKPTTTGVWYPRKPTPPWTTTCGDTPTPGPAADTPTKAESGSPPATSAPSTKPETTSGSSATAPAAPTSTGTPGVAIGPALAGG